MYELYADKSAREDYRKIEEKKRPEKFYLQQWEIYIFFFFFFFIGFVFLNVIQAHIKVTYKLA